MGCLFIIPIIIRDVYMVCISEGRDLGAIVGFYPLSIFLIVIKWNSFVSSYGSKYLIFLVCFMNKFYEVKVVQSCLTLWDPVKCSPPDSSVHGILQARVLEPFPSPGEIPDLVIKPGFPALQADSLPSEPHRKPIFLWLNTYTGRNSFLLLRSCNFNVALFHWVGFGIQSTRHN